MNIGKTLTRCPLAVLPALMVMGAPARAQMYDLCADLWFTENQILDRAGLCLSDPAATVLFDQTGCSENGEAGGPADQEKLALIKERTLEMGCPEEPDTGYLRQLRLDLRGSLKEIPVTSTTSRACLQWMGEPIYLLAAPEKGAQVISAADYGDDVFWEYDTPGIAEGWAFLTVYLDGQQRGLGWGQMPLDESLCGAVVDWNG